MRDAILMAFIGGALLAAVSYPFTALLLWAWFTLATPHQAAYLAGQMPLNLIIAGVAFVSFALHGEFLKRRPAAMTWLLIAFMGWLAVSQYFSLIPDYSAIHSDRFIKIILFIVLVSLTVTSRLRFHALLWLFAIVMGFYGAKGGAYTIFTFGQAIYFGLDNTILYDNNHMGIGLAATLPLFLYLARHATHRFVKLGVWLVLCLTVVGIIGTHSRGAFVALVAFGGLLWWRSNHKLLGLSAAIVIVSIAFVNLPQHYIDRIATISEATEDDSFSGRVDAWVINWEIAQKYPITGAGLRTPYLDIVSQEVSSREPRAAHSIYFEVLGGTGFVGLALFLALFGYAIICGNIAEKRYAGTEKDAWRSSFGRYGKMSILVFATGGLSVSMEMWEGYLIVIALLGTLTRGDLPEKMVIKPATTIRNKINDLRRKANAVAESIS